MKKILVAFDGDEPAHLALERGAELAQALGAELGIVSVTPWRRGRLAMDLWADTEARDTALQAAGDWLRQRGISATLLSSGGDPADMIERVAEAHHFDTIVVGTRDLGPVGRFMQQSVSEHVATNARATVVIAR